MDDRVRVSKDRSGAEDHVSGFESPISISFSDFSSCDFPLETDYSAMDFDLPGPSATGTLPEPPHSSDIGGDSVRLTESATVDLPFVCDRAGCSKSFEKRYDLNRHLGWHDKKLKCPLPDCLKRYQYQKDLEKHIWSHHSKWAQDTNRKPIRTKCKICGVMLERPDNAKRHMDEVHEGKRRRRGPGG
ncbi:hypothetical protein V8C35DRAFT_133599 [Trichoderma chlorosporum]